MVNAADLKSAAAKAACGFEPRPRHRDIAPSRHRGARRSGQCLLGDRHVAERDGREPALANLDSYGHYAVGWAWAMDTPYQWTKQVASHWGGTRNGTIVHWPKGIQEKADCARSSAM